MTEMTGRACGAALGAGHALPLPARKAVARPQLQVVRPVVLDVALLQLFSRNLLDRVLLRRAAEAEPPPPTADETLAAATSAKVYRRGAWETRLLRTPFEYRPLTDDAMSFSTLAG